jgi:YesN/AraC family two-component response regulator
LSPPTTVTRFDAFEVHALDYLLKPIDDRRLAQALERAAAMLGYRQQDGYRHALRNYAGATQERYPKRSACARSGISNKSRWKKFNGCNRPATTSSCTWPRARCCIACP